MADYCGKTRTNYFSVTDVERFKTIIASCSAEYGLKIGEEKQANGSIKYCFYCDGVIHGLPDRNENENMESCGDDDYAEYDYDAFCLKLQEILPNNDAIIITHIGSEKMCYLLGGCAVITQNKYEYIDLTHEAVKLAATMLQNPDFTTQMDY